MREASWRAARLLGAGEALFESAGEGRERFERAPHERTSRALDAATLAGERGRGRAMALEAVVAEALGG